MEKLTQESTLIENKPSYRFLLHYDWENKLIWLSKNTTKQKVLRITSKCIPISEFEKDKFYRSRSSWGKLTQIGHKKECSYVTQYHNIYVYDYWKKFIYERYIAMKKLSIERLECN